MHHAKAEQPSTEALNFAQQTQKYTEVPKPMSFIIHILMPIDPSVSSSPSLHTDLFPLSYRTLAIRVFAIRQLVRRRSRVACASVALGALYGSLFGIVPS
jgi:hypothetical protein